MKTYQKFKTHNQKEINVDGTGLVGHITADYKTLKRILGNPKKDSIDYKSDAEWEIEFEDGMIATIYNYKDGVSYLGKRNGMPKTKITDWHVGGNSNETLLRIINVLRWHPNR